MTTTTTTTSNAPFVESRHKPRFKLQIAICVYPRNEQVVHGDTVDVSESGISAVLRSEAPLGELVRLTFSLPAGDVEIVALVRYRNAFRYGFQFMESGPASALIHRTCADLNLEQSVRGTP